MKLPKFKLSLNGQRRGKLNEGRNYGFGGGFAKRDGNIISLVMPVSACGDYYAEIIHSENTGKQWGNVHGLSYSKQDIFDKKNGVAYMICSILKYNKGGKYSNYDRDNKQLAENYHNLEKFINWFEKKFKCDKLTKIVKLRDNTYLFIVPLFWCDGTYKISLYKYLSRTGFFYEDGSPLDYLEKFDKNSDDKYMYNSIRPKLKQMIDGYIPTQKMTVNDGCPHNLGIVSYHFPKQPISSIAGASMIKMS